MLLKTALLALICSVIIAEEEIEIQIISLESKEIIGGIKYEDGKFAIHPTSKPSDSTNEDYRRAVSILVQMTTIVVESGMKAGAGKDNSKYRINMEWVTDSAKSKVRANLNDLSIFPDDLLIAIGAGEYAQQSDSEREPATRSP